MLRRLSASRYPPLDKPFTKSYYQILLSSIGLRVSGNKHALQLRLLSYIKYRIKGDIQYNRSKHVQLFAFMLCKRKIPAEVLKDLLVYILDPLDLKAFYTTFMLTFGTVGHKLHYDARIRRDNGEWTKTHHVVLVDRGIYNDCGSAVAFIVLLLIPSMDVVRVPIQYAILKRCSCNFIDYYFDWSALNVQINMTRYLCAIEDQQIVLDVKAACLAREKDEIPMRYVQGIDNII